VNSQQSLKLRILDYVFYVFLKCRIIKHKKSRFFLFTKKRKIRILELWPKRTLGVYFRVNIVYVLMTTPVWIAPRESVPHQLRGQFYLDLITVHSHVSATQCSTVLQTEVCSTYLVVCH